MRIVVGCSLFGERKDVPKETLGTRENKELRKIIINIILLIGFFTAFRMTGVCQLEPNRMFELGKWGLNWAKLATPCTYPDTVKIAHPSNDSVVVITSNPCDIVIDWDSVASGCDYFNLYFAGSTTPIVCTTSTYTVNSTWISGGSYNFKVEAVNSCGDSSLSEYFNFSICATPSNISTSYPCNDSIVATSSTVLIDWDSVACDKFVLILDSSGTLVYDTVLVSQKAKTLNAGDNYSYYAIPLNTCGTQGGSLLFTFSVRQTLTSNTDTVWAGNSATVTGASADLGVFTEFMSVGNYFKIRQNGTIEKVRFWVNKNGITALWIKVWRRQKGNRNVFDSVGISEDLYSKISAGAGINTITLSNPIPNVQEGDYYSIKITSGAVALDGLTSIATGLADLYYVGVNTGASYNWILSATKLAGYHIPCDFYMKAPLAVYYGNSIISGYNVHIGYFNNIAALGYDTTQISIPYKVSSNMGWTFQNIGIGGATLQDMSASFYTKVTNLKPAILITDGGVVNSIAGGFTRASDSSYIRGMVDSCSNKGIKLVWIGCLPWTNGTNEKMQQRDSVNLIAKTMVEGAGFLYIDPDSCSVGQFREGGDENNLWDIIPALTSDGVHFSAAGYTYIATEIERIIRTKYR